MEAISVIHLGRQLELRGSARRWVLLAAYLLAAFNSPFKHVFAESNSGSAVRIVSVTEVPADILPPSEEAEKEKSKTEDKEESEDKPKSYYVEPRSTGTRRETEPPRYVRNLSNIDFLGHPEATWLDLGLDYRMRYEFRDDDLRRPAPVLDQPFLLRTRAYVGVKEALDPFRFAIEYEDARRYNSQFPIDDRDVNENEIIQMYGELYFKNGLGEDRPFRLQAGRLAFEYVDRRLMARNEWRNTTNNFQGFRAILGQQTNDWQLDLFALQPMERRLKSLDHGDEERWFYGMVGDWRRWSKVVTLQPYYLVLDQDGKGNRIDRTVHTLALRGYGIIGETGFDYDSDVAFQLGNNGAQRLRAFAFTSEVGYTWDQPWKPRLSLFCGYASGDRTPNDNTSQRFDRLFGFARPWSADDYFIWENLIAPKTRIEFQPSEKLRIDSGYGVYWLANSADSWSNASLRDPTGQSGSFIGHELDIRVRYTLTERIDLTLGYAHFIPGEFPSNLGKGEDSDFFYLETSIRPYK